VRVVHESALVGFEAGVGAYRRARPGYAAPVLAELGRLPVGGPVVELGPGTGIVTAELVAAGHQVVAVEPVAAMREALADAVSSADVREGRAEAIPVDDGVATAVVAAQSFHWFDPDAALDEIARVLPAGGRLVLMWNVRDESVPWVAAFGAVTNRYRGDTPSHHTGRWRQAIDDDRRFALDHELETAHGWPTDVDGVVERALSVSFIAALDEAQRRSVAAEVRALAEPLGPSFDFPYRSSVHVWEHLG